MQLKIQRSQRAGGVTGGTVFFCLDVRADYAPEEQANIRKYKLGGQVIYNSQAARRHLDNAGAQLDRTQSGGVGDRAAGLARGALSFAMAKMQLSISIDSLGRGQHVECKDLAELLETEETVRTACKDLTRYLDAAATFNGSETVVEYVNGEEKIHITQDAAPLQTSSPSGPVEYEPGNDAGAGQAPMPDFGRSLSEFWSNPQYRKFTYIGAGAVFVLFLLHSCI